MDERDAKTQGLEVHRRDMAFVRGYVTCTTCACNYDCSQDKPGQRVPTFCQIYSLRIDPSATDANILRAEACDQWVHENLDRNKVVHPNHSYRYDKWGD
jgi:hypothetical protein